MNDTFEQEFRKSMDHLHFSEASKAEMTQILTAQSAVPGKFGKHRRKLVVVMLAAVIALMMFTGAAVYTQWSRSMEARYQPTQEIKERSENSGLSTMLESSAASTEVLSATDQGITITAVQSIMDMYGALFVFRVDGFDLPDGAKPVIRLSRDEMITGLHSSALFPQFLQTEQGYVAEDGSLEFSIQLVIPKANVPQNVGKGARVEITAIGTEDFPSMYRGSWKLQWKLNRSTQVCRSKPQQEIGDTKFTLLETDITPITLNALFMVENFDGRLQILEDRSDPETREAGYQLMKMLVGFQTKDGILHFDLDKSYTLFSYVTLDGVEMLYSDYQAYAEDHILISIRHPLSRILEPEDVDALVFLRPGSADKPQEEWTAEDYLLVPLS